MLLALAEVEGESSMRRIIVLVLIALLITFAVYGLVAALIKLDDAGAHLAGQGRTLLSLLWHKHLRIRKTPKN